MKIQEAIDQLLAIRKAQGDIDIIFIEEAEDGGGFLFHQDPMFDVVAIPDDKGNEQVAAVLVPKCYFQEAVSPDFGNSFIESKKTTTLKVVN